MKNELVNKKRHFDKLDGLCEAVTLEMGKSGISKEDALLVVLNVLRYHSSLCMDEHAHAKFDKLSSFACSRLLRRAEMAAAVRFPLRVRQTTNLGRD